MDQNPPRLRALLSRWERVVCWKPGREGREDLSMDQRAWVVWKRFGTVLTADRSESSLHKKVFMLERVVVIQDIKCFTDNIFSAVFNTAACYKPSKYITSGCSAQIDNLSQSFGRSIC